MGVWHISKKSKLPVSMKLKSMLIYSWLLWQVLINETPFLNLDFLMNTCQQCRSSICGDMTEEIVY